MCKRFFLIAIICAVGTFMSFGQDEIEDNSVEYAPHSKHMWEFGIHAGHAFLNGDLDWDPGFGVGLHFRKAIDYVFSVRFGGSYTSLKGEDAPRSDGTTKYETNTIDAGLELLISLNSLIWHKQERKANLYVALGGGGSLLDVESTVNGVAVNPLETRMTDEQAAFLTAGLGIAFKFSPRFNLGIEHDARFYFGKPADLMDGFDNANSNVTTFRDVVHYTHLRFNFNLGKTEQKTEPLYWVNPMQPIMDDIAELKERPKLDLTDTDSDGVIDMLDKEPGSPAGAAVDTRGVTLDSDGDGVKDFEDAEPYSPSGYKVDEKGIARVDDPSRLTETDVNRLIDERLKSGGPGSNSAGLSNWFLPMIHFDFNNATLNRAEYGKLHHIATVLQQNTGISVVVIGHTDRTASNCYNNKLSYQRAANAIDFLSKNYGISRDRLVLNWRGEESVLVPTNGQNYINRRVEFKVADGESRMSPPDCQGKSPKGYSGNREAGY